MNEGTICSDAFHVREDLQSSRKEYKHLQCDFIGLKILILKASGLQIPMNQQLRQNKMNERYAIRPLCSGGFAILPH